MTDFAADVELGQCLNEEAAVIISCLVGSGGVTKGKFVKLADAYTIPPTVVACADAKAFGVALKTGAEGATIPVAIDNAIVKMEIGTSNAGNDAGVTIRPDGAGDVELCAAAGNALAAGVLLQTAEADGDYALVLVKCNAQVAPA